MAKIEKDIVVDVPVSVAYNQWTQFESFPEFMEGVKEVVQLDEKRLRWTAEIKGKDEEWEAEITDQVPDRHIAWRSVTGAPNAGISDVPARRRRQDARSRSSSCTSRATRPRRSATRLASWSVR